MIRYHNYVNGGFQTSQSKNWGLVSLNPSGEAFELADSQAMDVVEALRFAKEAQVKFAGTSFEQRKEMLLHIVDRLSEKQDGLAQELALAQGFAFDFVLESEVRYAQTMARFWIEKIQSAVNRGLILSSMGVVSLVPAWPLSFRQLAERVFLQILLGNTMIVKASSRNPFAAKAFADLVQEANLPPGVFQVLFGKGTDLLPLFCGHPSFQAVSFVGHQQTGDLIFKYAGLKPLHMSLGSKNSAIVFSDFLPEHLDILAKACFSGNGQLVQNIHRVFILEKDIEKFKPQFLDAIERFHKTQLNLRDQPTFAPVAAQRFAVAMPSRKESLLKAMALIKEEGGKVVGFDDPKEQSPLAFSPTLVFDLPNCSALQQQDLCGPVILVTTVKYIHEAVKWSNTTDFGHSALIFSGDLEKAKRTAEKLDVGQVWINQWMNPDVFDEGLAQKQSVYGPKGAEAQVLLFSRAKKLT